MAWDEEKRAVVAGATAAVLEVEGEELQAVPLQAFCRQLIHSGIKPICSAGADFLAPPTNFPPLIRPFEKELRDLGSPPNCPSPFSSSLDHQSFAFFALSHASPWSRRWSPVAASRKSPAAASREVGSQTDSLEEK